MIFAAHRRVHELQLNIFTYAFEIAIAPVLERISGGLSPAFLSRTAVTAAGWMGLHFIGRTPHDVNASAIGFPARYARGVVFVGIRYPTVVFFFECVVGRLSCGFTTLQDVIRA